MTSRRTDSILAELRAGMRDVDVAKAHGVSRSWVTFVRTRAGLPPNRPSPTPNSAPAPRQNAWTADQVAYLRDHPHEPAAEVATVIGRSVRSVFIKRQALIRAGELARRRAPYSADELAVLADTKLTNAEVAACLGRSEAVIRESRRERGIKVPGARTARRWTDAERAQLQAHEGMPLAEIAARLGRTTKAVQQERRKQRRRGHDRDHGHHHAEPE